MVDMQSTLDIAVESSGVSGTVVWSGDEEFNGDPIAETTFILRNIWSMTTTTRWKPPAVRLPLRNPCILQGASEATLTENGSFTAVEGIALASNFIGTFTRDIGDARTFFANGTWSGFGVIDATWVEPSDVVNCDFDNESNVVMSTNQTFCLIDDSGETLSYRLEGTVDAFGTFTSEGTSKLSRTYGDADAGQGENHRRCRSV